MTTELRLGRDAQAQSFIPRDLKPAFRGTRDALVRSTVSHDSRALMRPMTETNPIRVALLGATRKVGGQIGKMMQLVGGKSGFADYEAADLRIRTETQVPVTLVRPYGLTDKDGKDVYKATTKVPVTFALPIARADLAKFLLDATTNPQWDGPQGVQLTGTR